MFESILLLSEKVALRPTHVEPLSATTLIPYRDGWLMVPPCLSGRQTRRRATAPLGAIGLQVDQASMPILKVL